MWERNWSEHDVMKKKIQKEEEEEEEEEKVFFAWARIVFSSDSEKCRACGCDGLTLHQQQEQQQQQHTDACNKSDNNVKASL